MDASRKRGLPHLRVLGRIRSTGVQSSWQALRQELAFHSTFIRLALVGGTGYVAYQAILFLVYDSSLFPFLPAKDTGADFVLFEHSDVRLLIATLLASALTLVGQFAGHNLWTFRDKASLRKPPWMRFGQFLAAALTSTAIVIVTVNVLTLWFDIYHFVALPIGASLGGAWTWLWYNRLVWRQSKEESLEQSLPQQGR
jgi:putative flippase GtrA